MSKIYSPKIVTDSLVMCLDASNNKSYPTDLPVKNGLNLWLDAADDTTFSYSSGTVVSQWRDKSGLNNHVSQATVANQPSRSTTKNSRKTLVFDGGDTLFNSGNVFPSNTTNYTKIAVVYQTSTATTGNVIGSRSTTSGSNYGHTIYFGGLNFRMWHDTDIVTSNISLSLNTLGIISATYVNSSGLGSVFLNGTASGTGTAANRNIVRDIEIGGLFGGNNFTGEICEALVFSRVLSATELKQVHTYLGQKWGISNTDRSIVDLSNNNIASFGGAAGSQTVANMPTFDFYNKGALRFDGGDYVQTTTTVLPVSHTSPFTLEAFCCPSTVSVAYQTVLGTMSSFSQIGFVNNTFAAGRNGGGGGLLRNSLATVVANTWYHICMTYNGTNASFYLNGSFLSTQTIGTNGINNGVSLLGSYSSSSPSETFNGTIAAARIYQKALSAAEVLQNYEAQKSKFANTIVQQGLVLNLDAGNPYSYAGAGTAWYDVSGNGKIGTLTGGVTYSSLYGGDFVLDGVNGYIQTDLNQNTDNAQITWEAWFWDNSAGIGANLNTAIISNYGAVATTPFTILHIFDNGIPFFGQRNSSGTADEAVYGTSICNGVWHHLVGVVDSSNMLLYVDGVIGASKTKITGTTTSGQNLVIGGNHLGRYQSCRIASARCYNIALSAAQVLQNYNATKGRFGL